MGVVTGTGESVWRTKANTTEEFLAKIKPPTPLPKIKTKEKKEQAS